MELTKEAGSKHVEAHRCDILLWRKPEENRGGVEEVESAGGKGSVRAREVEIVGPVNMHA